MFVFTRFLIASYSAIEMLMFVFTRFLIASYIAYRNGNVLRVSLSLSLSLSLSYSMRRSRSFYAAKAHAFYCIAEAQHIVKDLHTWGCPCPLPVCKTTALFRQLAMVKEMQMQLYARILQENCFFVGCI